MKFITSKIVTTPVSLETAIKNAKNQPEPRSLGEILNSIKEAKTAAVQGQVKTASTENPVVVASAEKPATEMPNVVVKVAEIAAEVKAVEQEKPVVATATAVTAPAAKTSEEKPTTEASGKKTLKVASKLDFRNWEAKAVVDAWVQHGSIQKCMANVKGMCNDPASYCTLLSFASAEADKVIKSAKTEKVEKTAAKEEKTSSKELKPAPVYKKIAKLTSEEHSMLKEYFAKIYGQDYVDALLEDY